MNTTGNYQKDWGAFVQAVHAIEAKQPLYAEELGAMLAWAEELRATYPQVDSVLLEKIGDWNYALSNNLLPPSPVGNGGGGGGGGGGGYPAPPAAGGLLEGNLPLLLGAAVLAWFFLGRK